MTSIYKTKTPEATIQLGRKLGQRLNAGDVVLLSGNLGAGKTHFTKGIAEGLGITMTIKSPTFAYVNRYPLKNRGFFNHFDLYRLNKGDDFTSIGLYEALEDPRAVTVVEWADRLGKDLPLRYVRVRLSSLKSHHEIKIDFIDSRLTKKLVADYYKKWQTPMHVRGHCAQVAKVGLQVGKHLIKKGEIVDLKLLEVGCLLHDMTRVCDFRTLDLAQFHEKVTGAKLKTWNALRKKYEGIHHADIGFEALKHDGFDVLAEVIRLHKATAIVDEPASFTLPESKIVYYADKRVRHTEIVSIRERFKDGRARYGKYNTPDQTHFYTFVEKATLKLEKELLG